MVDVIQIVVTVFALFALSRALIRFKDSKITAGEMIFWGVIWVTAIAVMFLKNYLGFLSRLSTIGRPVDLIVYVSILLLFYLVFRIYVKIERVEQEITQVVRTQALKQGKKK